MHELNEMTKSLLKKKIHEVVSKNDITPSELDCIYKAYEILDKIASTDAMEIYVDKNTKSSYTHTREPEEVSWLRGRGSSLENNHSYHSVKDRIIADLEHEINDSMSDYEKKKIMDAINIIHETM